MSCPALQFLVLTITGWLSRHQAAAMEYLIEENRILREQLDGRRLRLTGDDAGDFSERFPANRLALHGETTTGIAN